MPAPHWDDSLGWVTHSLGLGVSGVKMVGAPGRTCRGVMLTTPALATGSGLESSKDQPI